MNFNKFQLALMELDEALTGNHSFDVTQYGREQATLTRDARRFIVNGYKYNLSDHATSLWFDDFNQKLEFMNASEAVLKSWEGASKVIEEVTEILVNHLE